MQHLVVLSDLHLRPVSEHTDLWMGCHHRRYRPDPELARLLDLLGTQIPEGQLELVFNGDTFDFERWPGGGEKAPPPRRGEEAVAALDQILDGHAEFLDALARLLLRCHRIVFLAGNQDLQLTFPQVRGRLGERLVQACQRRQPACAAEVVAARIEVHPWFYQTRYGVHIEHGNQYDAYCSVPDPIWPFAIDGQLLKNFQTRAQEHLAGNPPTSPGGMATHLVHSVRLLWELVWAYGLHGRCERLPELQQATEVAHRSLFVRPDVRAAMRLLRLDWALILASGALTTVLLALAAPWGLGAALATAGLFRQLRPRRWSAAIGGSEQVETCARALAQIYGSRAVVFGHTHQPAGRWEGEVFYGSAGGWMPMRHGLLHSLPVRTSRSLVWLHQEVDALQGGMFRFHEGELHPIGEHRPWLTAPLVLLPPPPPPDPPHAPAPMR